MTSSMVIKWSKSIYESKPQLGLGGCNLACIYALFERYAWMVLVEYFSCVSYPSQSMLVPGKVLVKFRIKKSHEMISYILVGMALLRK